MTKALTAMYDNLINGNIDDAKRQAKRFSWSTIFDFIMQDIGDTAIMARATAGFLKGKNTFQEYCDTKARE